MNDDQQTKRDAAILKSRRQLLISGASLAASALAFGVSQPGHTFKTIEPVAAGELLMQEHGVLGRILLIYDRAATFLQRADNIARVYPQLILATKLVKTHIQAQHERVEELLIFPVLTKANKETDLVAVLVAQHQAGQECNEAISMKLKYKLQTASNRKEIARLARAFSSMFRPHALREDTVIYPKLLQILGETGYAELSAKVDALEDKMANDLSLSEIVSQVASIETALGVNDLSQFTVKV